MMSRSDANMCAVENTRHVMGMNSAVVKGCNADPVRPGTNEDFDVFVSAQDFDGHV